MACDVLDPLSSILQPQFNRPPSAPPPLSRSAILRTAARCVLSRLSIFARIGGWFIPLNVVIIAPRDESGRSQQPENVIAVMPAQTTHSSPSFSKCVRRRVLKTAGD